MTSGIWSHLIVIIVLSDSIIPLLSGIIRSPMSAGIVMFGPDISNSVFGAFFGSFFPFLLATRDCMIWLIQNDPENSGNEPSVIDLTISIKTGPPSMLVGLLMSSKPVNPAPALMDSSEKIVRPASGDGLMNSAVRQARPCSFTVLKSVID